MAGHMRQARNKGFTLLEMLAVLTVISALQVLTLHYQKFDSFSFAKKLLIAEYAKVQNDAIYRKDMEIFEYDDLNSRYEIYFNGRGNVNMAQTVDFLEWKDFIIWLGCGRIHEK